MTTLRFQGVFTITAVLMPHTTNSGKLTQTIVVSEVTNHAPHFMFLLCCGKVLDVVDRLKLGDMVSVNGWITIDNRASSAPKTLVVFEVGSISILNEIV